MTFKGQNRGYVRHSEYGELPNKLSDRRMTPFGVNIRPDIVARESDFNTEAANAGGSGADLPKKGSHLELIAWETASCAAKVMKLASAGVLVLMLLLVLAPVTRTEAKSGVCYRPPHTGPCRGYFQRYYYNRRSGRCETFVWGGCRSNGNNFKTRWQCLKTCVFFRG